MKVNHSMKTPVSGSSEKESASLYRQQGMAYHDNGDTQKALEMYKKARIFYEKIGDRIMRSEVELFTASIYIDRDEESKALKILEKILVFYEKTGNEMGIANVTSLMGDTLLKRGEIARALEMEKKALSFYEKTNNKWGLGRLYSRKGRYYFFSGDFSKAMAMYEKALAFLDAGKYPADAGKVYHGMGDIYMYRGDTFQALRMHENAAAYFEKAGSMPGLSEVYRSKGFIFSFIGAPARSLEMYDKSLLCCEKAGNPSAQVLANYLGKAVVYLETGDFSRSINMYDEAYSLLDKVESPYSEGWIYLGKARVYLSQDDFARSEEMCKKAQTVFEQLAYPQAYSHVYESLADIYLTQQEWRKALEIYDRTIPVFARLGDIESLSTAKLKKASAHLMLAEIDEAFILLDESFLHQERFRTQTAFSEMKRSFMEEAYPRWELILRMVMHYEYYERAFKYAELVKVRLFLDQLGEGLIELEKGIPAHLLAERDNLTATLSRLTRDMHDTQREDERSEIKEQYQKTEREYEDLLVKIRLNNPLYASVKYPRPVTIRELQREVLKEGEALLRYLIAKDEIYIFLVSARSFEAVTLENKAGVLKQIVSKYLYSVKKNDSPKMIAYGKELYLTILKPIESWLQGVTDLIVVPDGVLAKIPFESFVMETGETGRPVYLLERYRIKYIQGASVLSFLRKYSRKRRGANSFIGIGDPVYDYENFRLGKPEQGSLSAAEQIEAILVKYDRERGCFNRLKASGEEVENIAGLFRKHGRKGVVYLREQAREEKVKAPGMKDFDYIHIACHGILGEGFQCLILSQIPGAVEDGFLTLDDIMNCEFDAKLVVLSACQTALGKMERAEGVTGLISAVMYAGTAAVAAGLWSISDTGAKELMVKFYTNILEKEMSEEEALRQAKLSMVKSKQYASPYFWSAFVMYGE